MPRSRHARANLPAHLGVAEAGVEFEGRLAPRPPPR